MSVAKPKWQPLTPQRRVTACLYFVAGIAACESLFLLVAALGGPPSGAKPFSVVWQCSFVAASAVLAALQIAGSLTPVRSRSHYGSIAVLSGPAWLTALRIDAVLTALVVSALVFAGSGIHFRWLLIAASSSIGYCALICLFSAYQREVADRKSTLDAAIDALPKPPVEIAPVYSGVVSNRYLTHREARLLEFRPSAAKRWRLWIVFTLASLMYSALDAILIFPPLSTWLDRFSSYPASNSQESYVLLIGWIMLMPTVLICAHLLADAQVQTMTRLQIAEAPSREYVLRSYNRSGWKQRRSRPLLPLTRPIVRRGSLNSDLQGVGLKELSDTAYKVIAAWRFDDIPRVELSQTYSKYADAEAAMRDISALLQVPMLGMLDA